VTGGVHAPEDGWPCRRLIVDLLLAPVVAGDEEGCLDLKVVEDV
jgi:hypothetical protein